MTSGEYEPTDAMTGTGAATRQQAYGAIRCHDVGDVRTATTVSSGMAPSMLIGAALPSGSTSVKRTTDGNSLRTAIWGPSGDHVGLIWL